MIHACTNHKTVQIRRIASEGIVNEFRSKKTHPLLIEILAELYGIKTDGTTNTSLKIQYLPHGKQQHKKLKITASTST